MLLSVLLPTRERYEWLTETISSFYDNCSLKNIDNFEIILYFDEDDESLNKIIPFIEEKKFNNIRILVSATRHTWAGIDIYYNEMAKLAQGKWLIAMNDDCKILTKDWDMLLEEYGDSFTYISGFDTTAPDFYYGSFAFIPKKWVEVTNNFSSWAVIDRYMGKLADQLNIIVKDLRFIFDHNINHEPILNRHSPPAWPLEDYKRDLEVLKNYLGLEHVYEPKLQQPW